MMVYEIVFYAYLTNLYIFNFELRADTEPDFFSESYPCFLQFIFTPLICFVPTDKLFVCLEPEFTTLSRGKEKTG